MKNKISLESLKNATPKSNFEKFPKIIFTFICKFLKEKEIMKLSSCSKSLTFSLLCSNYSQQIWKDKLGIESNLEEKEFTLFIEEEKKQNSLYSFCNPYLLLSKHSFYNHVWHQNNLGSNLSLSNQNKT